MRVAFYAPLKAPDHPVASGDRQIARLLVQALEQAGHRVELASTLRSYDGSGDELRQARLRSLGISLAARAAQRLAADAEPIGCWLTYHLYYKAPDWIGPTAARALGVPYVVAEASYAAKQAHGPWRLGLAGVREALGAARAVVTLKAVDVAGVRPHLAPGAELAPMTPFVDAMAIRGPHGRDAARRELADSLGLDPQLPWLAAVAMMRPGDKCASYRLLARALEMVADRPWQLAVIGDGDAAHEVRAALAGLGVSRVRFAGAWSVTRVRALLCGLDVVVWPALGEAIGMVLLEAAAAGVPVVSARTGGVPEVVHDGSTGLLVEPGDAAAFANALRQVLEAPHERARLGAAARAAALSRHSVPTAAAVLDGVLARACARPR